MSTRVTTNATVLPSGDRDGSDTEIRRPMSEGRMTSTVAKHQPALPRTAASLDRSRNAQNFWGVLVVTYATDTPRTSGLAGPRRAQQRPAARESPHGPRKRPHGFLTSACDAAFMRRGIVIVVVISSFAFMSTGCKPPGSSIARAGARPRIGTFAIRRLPAPSPICSRSICTCRCVPRDAVRRRSWCTCTAVAS